MIGIVVFLRIKELATLLQVTQNIRRRDPAKTMAAYDEQNPIRQRLWFIVSVCVAAIAFVQGPARPLYFALAYDAYGLPPANSVAFSIWLGWLWIATFVAAAVAYRWKSLWLLIAGPFALFYPAVILIHVPQCGLFAQACFSLSDLMENAP